PAMQRILDRGDPIDRGALAVTGADLLDAGIPKGPALGKVLKGLLDFVLEDPSRNTREVLLRQAKALS
ncbi:MAG TPA: polynucleotide adenylyltransferase, partial [Gemmatimonadales bacterium]|nr:polynucleotide adenylyltransferase [Gemmatimonadales bacterium]